MITTRPANAVALTSICRNRSSRPSPRSPRIVSLLPPNRITAPKPAMIANETSPLPGSPFDHWIPRNRKPSARLNSGTTHFE